MKLLIIEDSQRLLRSLGSGLKKVGYAVDLVADGVDGLGYARLNDYDAIILDLMLPGMDGLTILGKLRPMGKQTHILILSAKDQVERCKKDEGRSRVEAAASQDASRPVEGNVRLHPCGGILRINLPPSLVANE